MHIINLKGWIKMRLLILVFTILFLNIYIINAETIESDTVTVVKNIPSKLYGGPTGFLGWGIYKKAALNAPNGSICDVYTKRDVIPLNLGLCAGKNNFSVSTTWFWSGLYEAATMDTDTESTIDAKLGFTHWSFLGHYQLGYKNVLEFTPEVGISYLRLNSYLKRKSKDSELENVYVDDIRKGWGISTGISVTVISPVTFMKWKGEKAYTFLEGKYSYITPIAGINNIECTVGIIAKTKVPFSKGKIGITFRQYQNNDIISRYLGLTVFAVGQ